ncbi:MULTISPECIES: hypothetical protein [unclassified Pseudomonas]|uniref:hypothetical protein n=1 Tax=Pseudomonas TaxID=286 RepID=UPI000C8890DF|nr:MULTISPECIES: hypothetical protein [unclassified Pseudomonas]PMX28805.1 hypothetical protein C1Y23_03635 [Pseudomonas sp. GW460-12]PMX36095.1 hypothetical protein C1Y24_07465 [Pseudomonas sp. MPR-R2A4]PMX40811.1 hypothetical protein C1Y26_13185 [Pseudomonas sp. MPR-R2A7]PMX52391.1 hypothetical protein C1Y17_19125 [Pseudomonas sp. MPR-R2A6]PMX90408.1 hypothetical protein C1Y21_16395 [Pseudomonas sp. MPR-R2A3]
MKPYIQRIIICLIIGFAASADATSPPIEHLFERNLDQMLADLPSLYSRLSEVTLNDGTKQWNATVPVGGAKATIQYAGKDKDRITGLSVTLVFTPDAGEQDYEHVQALREVIFQEAVGDATAFREVNNFFSQEIQRQQSIILVGGKPQRVVQMFDYGTTELSVGLSSEVPGLLAYYSIRLL